MPTVRTLTLALSASILCMAAGSAFAQESAPAAAPKAKAPAAPVLKAGDPAPAMTIAEWVKGDAVKGFEPGKVYVVEFWATWCGPCIAGMPHLSKLQKQYKDKGLTIIGVTSEDPGNSLEDVRAMVKDKGDTMGYTVAWDTKRDTNNAYMKAARKNGIPCAFVVDKAGKIAFIGHPMFLDPILEKVVAGTWDSASDPAKFDTLMDDMQAAYGMIRKDPKGAISKIEEISKAMPALGAMMLEPKYFAQLQAGDSEAAAKTGRQIVEKAIADKDSEALNSLAWSIVDPQGSIEPKDVELALIAAKEASTLTGDKDGAILDTLARAHFLKGDTAKAIEIQKKAIEHAPDQMKSDMKATLKEYEGKK
jgi:thiol-disulfide isomerase/thioredoxin